MACKSDISLIFVLCLLSSFFGLLEGCDEFQCASIISKCMLNQSCKCDWTTGTETACYRDCVRCLGYEHFVDCCSCVDICPANYTNKFNPIENSVVEVFEGVPALFDEFVQLKMFWKVITFRTHVKNHLNSTVLAHSSVRERHHSRRNKAVKKCSVLYLDNCTPLNKCSTFCRSTGASSYRWFRNGCCECIGSRCPTHGLKKIRCQLCQKDTVDLDPSSSSKQVLSELDSLNEV